LSAEPTIFAKLRIKSEKADAYTIGFGLAQWFRRQLFRTLSSALRQERENPYPHLGETRAHLLPVTLPPTIWHSIPLFLSHEI
jgi:hypothetical protein